MPHLSLYRKYRPMYFKDVVGQEDIIKSLSNSVITTSFSHAYIFSGPRGTGKTTLAKIFARSINCKNLTTAGECCNECKSCKANFSSSSLDILEIDAASNNGIPEVKEIIKNIKSMPNISEYKIYILDEAHMLSKGAFNVLLKTIEEPPEHAIFILATTNVYKLPLTILSRCQRFNFSLLLKDEIINNLALVLNKEKIPFESEALKEICLLAEGSMRDALSILEQVISISDKKVTVNAVSRSFKLLTPTDRIDFTKAIFNNNTSKIIEIKNKIINNSIDINSFMISIIDILKSHCERYLLKYDNFDAKSFDRVMDVTDLIMKEYFSYNMIKSQTLYFEFFILKLLKIISFKNKINNTTKKDSEKLKNNDVKNNDILDITQNNNAEVAKNAIPNLKLQKVKTVEEQKENKVSILNKADDLKQDLVSLESLKNIVISKINSNFRNTLNSIDNKYISIILKIFLKSDNSEIVKKIKKIIVSKNDNNFLFFYKGFIPIATDKGFIVFFKDKSYVNYLKISLSNKSTRKQIFNKLGIEEQIIIPLTSKEFYNIKNNIIFFQNMDYVFEENNIDEFYNSLVSKENDLETKKITEIFGKDIQINIKESNN